jgi:hypothetical protein
VDLIFFGIRAAVDRPVCLGFFRLLGCRPEYGVSLPLAVNPLVT